MTEMRKRINLEKDKSRIFAGENSKRCVHHDSLLPKFGVQISEGKKKFMSCNNEN